MSMRLFSIVAGSLLAVSSLAAQTTLGVPVPFATIQAAINAAMPGDEVVVAPGVYVEIIDFVGKDVSVRSSGGAATTVIDGGGSGPVVRFIAGEGPGARLDGFTVRNGIGAAITVPGTTTVLPGGILCVGSSPTIRRCVIDSNVGGTGTSVGLGTGTVGNQGGPGGVLVVDGQPVLAECVVTSNLGGTGGTGVCGGPGFFTGGIGGEGGAGGMRVITTSGSGLQPLISRCHFEGNTGGTGGAGSCPPGSSGTAVAGAGGPGALAADPGALLRIVLTVMRFNGGGAAGIPTGATIQGGRGGAGAFRATATSFFFGAPGFELNGCAIVANLGGDGTPGVVGGLAGHGGGSTGGTMFTALGTTVAGNTRGNPPSAQAAGGLELGGSMLSSFTLISSIFWGNTGGDLLPLGFPPAASHCNIGSSSSPVSGPGNFSADPLFANLPGGAADLLPGSPCRHAGILGATSVNFDLDGDFRWIGPMPDVGADELDELIGSREDFVLALSVDGAFAPQIGATPASAGNSVSVHLLSPDSTFASATLVLAADLYLPLQPPAPLPGFPDLHLSATTIVLQVLSGFPSPIYTVSGTVPPGIVGAAIRFQAFAAAPQARNGSYASSAARDVIFQ